MSTIAPASPRNERFFHLLGDIRADLRNLLGKEMALARTELGEKVQVAARNAAFLAAGGVAAVMAVLLLLLGLGGIVAAGLAGAGLSAGTAYFLAYAGLAVVVGLVGFFLVRKALRAYQTLSLAPDKTLETMKGHERSPAPGGFRQIEIEHPRRSSDQIQTEVEITMARMDEEVHELRQRLTPAYLARSTVAGVKHHPLRTLLITAGTGLGGYLLWKYNHRSGTSHPAPTNRKPLADWAQRLRLARS